MRIVFYNPHVESHVGQTVLNYLTRIYSFKKFAYLFNYLNKFNKVSLFIEPHTSSFPQYISKYIPYKIEVYFWLIINKIKPNSIKIIYDIKDTVPLLTS